MDLGRKESEEGSEKKNPALRKEGRESEGRSRRKALRQEGKEEDAARKCMAKKEREGRVR